MYKKEVWNVADVFKPGDYVVYRKLKHTTHPGRRARAIRAASNGDHYSYVVDKFWLVLDVLEDGRLRLQTPGGKTHLIDRKDVNLRRANLLDRILNSNRFAKLRRNESL